MCTQCQAKGSVIKHLHEYEVNSAHEQEQWLTSAQHTNELSKCIQELWEEKQGLIDKQAALEKEVQSLTKQLVKSMVTKGMTTPVESENDVGTHEEAHVTQETASEFSHSEH